MKRFYLYTVTLDGPECGMEAHGMMGLLTDTPKHFSALDEDLDVMGYDHVTTYIDEEEYEEENGVELEYTAYATPYHPDEHSGYITGCYETLHECHGYDGTVAQDENGYWYLEK